MKFIIALLLSMSAAMASDLDATRALTDMLPVGHYSGVTEDGTACAVSISREEGGVLASVFIEGVGEMSRLIKNGTAYRFRPGQRYFLSSEFTPIRDGRLEETFRTIAVDTFLQYVVVARRLDTTSRTDKEDARECVVSLL